jgi:hypothetical protein
MGIFTRQWAYLHPQLLQNLVEVLLGNGDPHSEQRFFWEGHADKSGRLSKLGSRGAHAVGTKAFARMEPEWTTLAHLGLRGWAQMATLSGIIRAEWNKIIIESKSIHNMCVEIL